MNARVERLMKTYCEYKNMIKQLNGYLDDIQVEILTELGDIEEYIGVEHSISYKEIVSRRVDTKMIKNKYPEIAEECTTTSRSFRFVVK